MATLFAGLTSCNKDNLISGNGEETTVTITAQMPSGTETRATADYGKGEKINRCIMEVYTSKGALYSRKVVATNGKNATFDLRLVASQNYDFLFWADHVESTDKEQIMNDNLYNTESLKSVSIKNFEYVGNDENRDAFFAHTNKTIEATTTLNVEMKRPFGQLNVTTKLSDVIGNLTPDRVQIAYTSKLHTTLNIMDGEVSGQEEMKWTAAVDVTGTIKDNSLALSVDYLFAPQNKQYLVDFEMFFYKNDALITSNDNFKNIPVQQNYKTNITGELLTKQGTFNVTVDPMFEKEDINKEIISIDATTVDEINSALLSSVGKEVNKIVQINMTAPIDNKKVGIVIPAATKETTPSITFNFSNTISQKVTIGEKENETFSGVIHIIAPMVETGGTFDINMPNSTVILNGVKLTNGTFKTAENTLVVDEKSSVETVTIEGGNVIIYGNIGTIQRSTNNQDEKTIVTVYSYAPYNAKAPEKAGENQDKIEIRLIDRAVENLNTGAIYSFIQEAIDEAKNGDVITVDGGPYVLTKSLIINKAISVKSKTSSRITIDASSADLELLTGGYSTAGAIVISSNDVVLDGFNVIGSGKTSWGVIVVGINDASKLPAYFPSEGSQKIRIESTNYQQPSNVTIKNCDLSAKGATLAHGFFIQAKGTTQPEFNTFIDNVGIKDMANNQFCAVKLESGNIKLTNVKVENVTSIEKGVFNWSSPGRVEFDGVTINNVDPDATFFNNQSWTVGWKPRNNGEYGWNWVTVRGLTTNMSTYKMNTYGKYNATTGVIDGVTNNDMGVSYTLEMALRSALSSKGIEVGEKLSYKDVQNFTGVLDLSNNDIDCMADVDAKGAIDTNAFYNANINHPDGSEKPYGGGQSNFARALKNITKIDLSGNTFKTIYICTFYGPDGDAPKGDKTSHSLAEIVLPESCTEILNWGVHKLPSLERINLGNITCMNDFAMSCNVNQVVSLNDLNPNLALGKKTFRYTPLTGNLDEYAKHLNIWFGLEWLGSNRVESYDLYSFEETKVTGTAAGLQNSKWTYRTAFTNSCEVTGDALVVPNSITRFGSWLFQKWQIKTAQIPSSVTDFGGGVFNQCPNLETVSLFYSETAAAKNGNYNLLGSSTARIKAIEIRYTGEEPANEAKAAFEAKLFSEADLAAIAGKVSWKSAN